MLLFLMALEIVLATTAQLMLRHGAVDLEFDGIGLDLVLVPLSRPWVLGGLALHGASFFLYVYILSRLQLNILYPIATGATIALIVVASTILFKESINGAQVLGIGAILVGISLVYVTS
jgi:multidrug transporter EmrE-like cation transporter